MTLTAGSSRLAHGHKPSSSSSPLGTTNHLLNHLSTNSARPPSYPHRSTLLAQFPSREAKMALPTQQDFLANDLEPHPAAHEKCSICHDAPMTSPVRTPCKHEFCKHCITDWLSRPEVNTRPMCRRQLFQLAAIPNRVRRAAAGVHLALLEFSTQELRAEIAILTARLEHLRSLDSDSD
jgi:hypothetical protein